MNVRIAEGKVEHTDDGTAVVELVRSGDVDDLLYIILPGSIPVRRVRAQPARDLGCCPMRDTSSRRLGVDILQGKYQRGRNELSGKH